MVNAIKLPLRLAALAAMVALRHAARQIGRALDVPSGARIARPKITRWAIERRPPEDGWPMHCTLHHDDMGELSPVTVYEPLRWGPVVLVQVVEYDGVGDVWILPASGELVTPAGIQCLKDDREVLETIRREAWAAEMAGEGL